MADKQATTTEKQAKKGYDPREIEPEIYRFWIDGGYYHAEPDGPGKPYCIVIPPPNVTDRLHLGHGLNNTIQDILTRWRRMAGDNAVWIPGTDHAGIATQTVVEKRVLAEQGRKRTDFNREEFVAIIQKWKDEYEATILGQLRAMGCSCDWDRTRFTMDPVCARAVREAFFRLFKDGLIYRGKRLVNWDPATQTALADDEVEMEEIDGHFWYLRYPLVEPVEYNDQKIEHVTVATTRPETMLGDTAVAMNPADPRIGVLKGKMVRLPIVNRVVPIIADEYVVLPNPESDDAKAKYASGFLKVTPAHDPNDYDIGRRHNLPMVNILAPDGSISEKHGWPEEDYRAGEPFLVTLFGKDRFEARKMVVGYFKENGLLEEVKPYRHSVGHSYRSHVPVEPYLSDQWYVAVKKAAPSRTPAGSKGRDVPGTDVPAESLCGLSLRALAQEQRTGGPGSPGGTPASSAGAQAWEGQLHFTPERYARTYEQRLLEAPDWCISRQLWWGHRIPVWRMPKALSAPPADLAMWVDRLMQWGRQGRIALQYRGEIVPLEWVEQQDLELTSLFVCIQDPAGRDADIVAALESRGMEQDPDVLDTWFSSALWPMSTLGWPEPAVFPEIFPRGDLALKTWNPSNTLSTAREIITLWVSRMVMFNLYFRDCLPFADVFIHAMIQDGEGRKMSKSLGNGVDPLDIIHSHGADAMRFTLASMTTQTQDVRMPVEKDPATGRNTSPKFDNGRNFANKIWQATTGLAIPNLEGYQPQALQYASLPLEDRWILSRLQTAIQTIDKALAGFQFADASQECYRFFWNEVCDWYLEVAKSRLYSEDRQERLEVSGNLLVLLEQVMTLLHPIMPFVTEEIYGYLPQVIAGSRSASLFDSTFPDADRTWLDPAAEAAMEAFTSVVGGLRSAREELGLARDVVGKVRLVEMEAGASAGIAGLAGPFRQLSGCELLDVLQGAEAPAGRYATVQGSGVKALLDLEGLVDVDRERERLLSKAKKAQVDVAKARNKLDNQGFLAKAPEAVVAEEREKLAAAEGILDEVRRQYRERVGEEMPPMQGART